MFLWSRVDAIGQNSPSQRSRSVVISKAMAYRVLHITSVSDESRPWLIKAEAVHRELRPQLDEAYLDQLTEIFGQGGELLVAIDKTSKAVVGVSLFRVYRDTFSGRKLYVDDLVTAASERSKGIGHVLMAWLKEEGVRRGAVSLILDSGCQRTNAHRFYFREGLVITAFNFKHELSPSQ
ncbi:hypothetical protein Ae201684P_017129 [Aphanomyces euteiches]|uniref:N-acetyltransferase domain-containing protein n=1 Tax=Aphanomyces euteiches TaxID=100861 RepID=A0A6G0W9F9_9STRA|nr:hypothetical protein Ae201684_017336 [Aphanomyces euteiches]KAH9088519.1 hypothetical protein Ae201684P_017129 [Aphanomyces euteiches]